MSDLYITSKNFSFNKEEVRTLASVKYWAVKSSSRLSTLPNRQSLRNIFRDTSDVVDESNYRQLKSEWCEEWKRMTCELLELGKLTDEDELPAKLKALDLSSTKSAAFGVEAATWEPFHELKKEEKRYQKLRVDASDFANYCKYISHLPELKAQSTLTGMRDAYQACITRIVKTINGSNYTWIWVGAGALALLLAAPYAATMVGGMMSLSGAAATSAGLAFLGGGSLAAGGMGMAGGYVVLMAGGAILGYGAGSKQQRDKFAETSKEEILINCAKLYAMQGYLDISINEVCKNVQAMQIDLDALADQLYCEGNTKEGEKQSSKSIVLSTYRRIARGEIQV